MVYAFPFFYIYKQNGDKSIQSNHTQQEKNSKNAWTGLVNIPYQHDELMSGQLFQSHSIYQKVVCQDLNQPNPQKANIASLQQECLPAALRKLRIKQFVLGKKKSI